MPLACLARFPLRLRWAHPVLYSFTPRHKGGARADLQQVVKRLGRHNSALVKWAPCTA
ncbi:hypothetical protein [Pseudomonas sp. BN102]|uniref:hypothetical protein n=1 Tax=Pseudomonas sp. BN102 TaxID=2567886 RepID=UPI00245891EA|nr:hypothetical protein [Pseudomonas sp. BN102]